MGIVKQFPRAWRCEVAVSRVPRDRKGNPLPEQSHTVSECLVGGRDTTDPVDRSNIPQDTIVMYADDPFADIQEGDRVEVPAGPRPSGRYRVHGSPVPWPLGLEVQLRRDGA